MRSSVLAPRILSAVFAVVLVAAGITPASAQDLPEARTLTVTPFLHTSLGIGEPAPDDSAGLGVAITYDWTPRLAFEGDIGHLFDVAGDNADIDWSVSTFSANALYRFDTKYVTPYATFGIGMERSSESLKATDSVALLADFSTTEFMINFGGGLTRQLNSRWQARADLRRFQANDLAPDFWRLYGGLTLKLK